MLWRVFINAKRIPRNLLGIHHYQSVGTFQWHKTIWSREYAKLAFEEVGKADAQETWLVTHGVLGSARNWRTFAKKFIESAEPWVSLRLLLVDLRNHGNSKGFQPPHTIEASARDLVDLVKEEVTSGSFSMVGHSLGGKIVLQYLKEFQRNKPNKLLQPKLVWILDSPPQRIENHQILSETGGILDLLSKIPLNNFKTQGEVSKYLQEQNISKAIAMWLCSSLARHQKGLEWKFDIEGARQMFKSFGETDVLDVVENPPKGSFIHFVKGELSYRLDGVEHQLLDLHKSSHPVSFHTLPNADHWLHVDNPEGLREMMLHESFKSR